MSFLRPSSFFHVAAFLGPTDLADLNHTLEALPVGSTAERWAGDNLMLAPPVSDDVVVQGRLEGAAGWPIWSSGTAQQGPPMPDELVLLARRVEHRLTVDGFWGEVDIPAMTFTSVYVDRYPRGGHFVPHTDRDCYGPVVAGVSGGSGNCRLFFTEPGGNRFEVTLRPGSLYAFTGALRYAPWVHAVDTVDDVRYAISLRGPASAQDPAGTQE